MKTPVLASTAFAAFALIACQAEPAASEAAALASAADQPTVQGAAAAAVPSRTPDVIYVPTPDATVQAMLKLGEVKSGDVLYDLGSGDGRIPVAAAKQFGVRAVGIDIDPQRIAEANENARKAGVTDKAAFRNEDLFQTDFSEATVVTLYLLPSLNERLMPKLLAMKPGTRIVSHAFRMGDWEPEQTIDVQGGGTIYRWTVPQAAGN